MADEDFRVRKEGTPGPARRDGTPDEIKKKSAEPNKSTLNQAEKSSPLESYSSASQGEVAIIPPMDDPEDFSVAFTYTPEEQKQVVFRMSEAICKQLEEEQQWLDLQFKNRKINYGARLFYEYVQSLLETMIAGILEQQQAIHTKELEEKLRRREQLREKLEIKAIYQKMDQLKEMLKNAGIREQSLEDRLHLYLKLDENLDRWQKVQQLAAQYPGNKIIGGNFLFQITLKDLIMEVKKRPAPDFLNQHALNINDIQIFTGLITELFLYSLSTHPNKSLEEHIIACVNEYGQDAIECVWDNREKSRPMLATILYVFTAQIFYLNAVGSESEKQKALVHAIDQFTSSDPLFSDLSTSMIARQIIDPDLDTAVGQISGFLMEGEMQGVLDLNTLRRLAKEGIQSLPPGQGPA